MDLAEDTEATPPDCWSGFDDLLLAVEVDPTLWGDDFTRRRLSDAMKIASHGNVLQKFDTAVEELEQVIRTHPDTLEAVLSAHYLSKTLWAPSLVLPFWGKVLHEVLGADVLLEMEDLVAEAIESMSNYGEDAASCALDVMGVLLTKGCPPKVKECALDFFLRTGKPGACDGVFSVVADNSDDPVIRGWNADRKLRESSEGGEEPAQ